MWYIHLWNIIQPLKSKDIMTHAMTWMNFEDIMLNEISQSRKDKYCVILLIQGTYSSHIHRNRKQNDGCQELRGGNGELLFNRYRVSVLQDEKSSGDWSHNAVNILNTTEDKKVSVKLFSVKLSYL